MKTKTIVTDSWAGNREIICFELTKLNHLKLLPGTFESEGEFRLLRRGSYVFVRMHDWLEERVRQRDVLISDQMSEFCICAAIKMPNGEVIYGHRHNHCYDVVRARTDVDREVIVKAEQGFVTSTGRFVGRKEAMTIQKASGRLSHYGKDGRYKGDILFSEDLY